MSSTIQKTAGVIIGGLVGLKIGGLVASLGLALSGAMFVSGFYATASIILAPAGLPLMALGALGIPLSLAWGVNTGIGVYKSIYHAIAGTDEPKVVHHYYHQQPAAANNQPVVVIEKEKPQPQQAPNIHFVYQAGSENPAAANDTIREATYTQNQDAQQPGQTQEPVVHLKVM